MATFSTAWLPDPNDEDSVRRHREAVLDCCAEVLSAVDGALAQAVPMALNIFGLLNGPRDRGVHATLTRYIVRTQLSGRGLNAEDEPLQADLEWVPNCGICIHVPGAEIRLFKASNGGVPKAGSDARSDFYCSNQMLLFHEGATPSVSDLKLVALWSIDEDYSYAGLEVACPRGELEDRTVDCYWKTRWSGPVVAPAREQQSLAEDADLDIQPIEPASSAESDG